MVRLGRKRRYVCLYVTSQKPVNSTTAFFAGVGISSCNSVVIIWVIIHLPPFFFFFFVSGSGTDSVLLHTHSGMACNLSLTNAVFRARRRNYSRTKN